MKTAIRNPQSPPQRVGGPAADPPSRVAGAIRNAKQYLVGGVNSPVRAFRQVGGTPLMVSCASGAELVDADGATLLDFIMGWGTLILGHNPPTVVEAIRRQMNHALLPGLTHAAEVELARLITEAVPSVEQVRFAVSGTEACMTAVRLARAHTGRSQVLTFGGCYHGHSDTLLVGKSAGISELTAQETLTVPFNDVTALEAAIERHGKALACAMIEPSAANMGVVPPEPGFLARLRELTHREGIVLIFDEVVTGFRVGLSGAQGLFGVTPDLTTFGKIIGGGLPIGAVGGPMRLMERLAPAGDVYHGGTFAGHPLSMAAGVAALTELRAHPPYERIERLAQQFTDGLSRLAVPRQLGLHINRVGSMFTIFFSEEPVRRFAQVQGSRRDRFAAWANALRDRGVLIPPSPYEAWFVSAAHTDSQMDRALEAAEEALQGITGCLR